MVNALTKSQPIRAVRMWSRKMSSLKMKLSVSFLRMGMVGLVSATTLMGAPTVANAQARVYYGAPNAGYDPCRDDAGGSPAVGSFVGAVTGAVVGSSIVSRKYRKDGALFGAIVGATVGASVSNGGSSCGPSPRQTGYYDNRDYGDGYDHFYGQARPYNGYGYASEPYGYQERRTVVVRRYAPQPAYDQGGYYGYQAPRAMSCALADSPIYLPDGRIQRRYVRVCPDANGRYQVVD